MQNLLLFIIRFYVFFLFLFFELVSLILLVSSSPFHRTGFINSANSISGFFYSGVSGAKSYLGLKEVNDSLMAENARLRNTVFPIASNKGDTIEYSDSTYLERYIYMPARVINNSVNNRNNFLMLNKGKQDGLVPEMGVITDKGVVGIVMDVSDHYASVLSILNSNARISAILNKTNYSGTVKWDGKDPNIVSMDDINKHVKIKQGDTVSTSGFSSVFPRGIPIGVIKEYNVEGNFYHLKIKLAQDIGNLLHVYSVKNIHKEERDSLEQSQLKLPVN